MAGYAHSDVETDITSIDTDTDSFFAGAYGQYYFGSVNLAVALMGGYEDHDSDRLVVDNLNGIETANSDFDSYFLSPSATLSAAYDLGNRVEFRPSATFVYSVAWFDDYNESGTTLSNLSIDDRTVQAIVGRLQLAIAATTSDENSEVELRGGFKARYTDDDDIDANLAGTTFRYASASDDSVYGGYLGFNGRVAVQDRLDLMTDIEYGWANGDETHYNLILGLEFTF